MALVSLLRVYFPALVPEIGMALVSLLRLYFPALVPEIGMAFVSLLRLYFPALVPEIGMTWYQPWLALKWIREAAVSKAPTIKCYVLKTPQYSARHVNTKGTRHVNTKGTNGMLCNKDIAPTKGSNRVLCSVDPAIFRQTWPTKSTNKVLCSAKILCQTKQAVQYF